MTSTDATRKREEYATKLRKKNKNVLFDEKRVKATVEISPLHDAATDKINAFNPEILQPSTSLVFQPKYTPIQADQLKIISASIMGIREDMTLLEGLIRIIRKALTKEDKETIQLVFTLGLIPKLCSLFSIDREEIILEIGWALTNIAATSSENVAVLRKAGVQYMMLTRLPSANYKIVEQVFPVFYKDLLQCLWCLSNMIGDSLEVRDEMLKGNMVTPILKALDNTIPLSLLRVASWALSNLCKGKPDPSYLSVKFAIHRYFR